MGRARTWLLLGLAVTSVAFYPARAQDGGEGAVRGSVHLGAGSCAAQACHGGGFAERAEYKIWATKDKHHKAFDALTGELGRRMGERLGIDPAADESCLCCHATTGVTLAKTFVMEDGVSCEICHGGAKEWLGPHATPDWQRLNAGQKEQRGLVDLSTPERRARTCVRCHVGAKDSDITHEIMAAGHPPLLFDAAAFLRDMPPHWKDDEDRSVATWVAGLKEGALAKLARIERAASAPEGGIEFSLFDCYSCHHPIYAGTVYERHAPPRRPGDLPLDFAGLEVLLIADGKPGKSKRFDRLLRGTFSPRGGDRDDLADLARSAAVELGELFPGTAAYTAEDARRYLANLDAYLARVASGEVRSPRGEMQLLVLAIRSLTGTTVSAELDAALDPRARFDAARCAALARALLAK